jgi:glycosyltransferase involved in cell wall biosynthesis
MSMGFPGDRSSHPMRVGIDARFVTTLPRRGIGTYSLNLIRSLVGENPDVEFFLYTRHVDHEGVLPRARNAQVRRLAVPLYPLWEQLALPLAASRDRVDILHCLGNTGPIFASGRPRQVLSLMDVMFLDTGEFVPRPVTTYQRLGRLYRSQVSPRTSQRADAVITISDFSRRDILRLIPGLDPARVTTIHLACDPAFSEKAAAEERDPALDSLPPSPFILCLGAEDPRKNTLRMVRAYLALLRNDDVAEDLVIAGYRNWERSPGFLEARKAGAESRIHFMPYVPMADLVDLYRRATLFAYPSLYEGFGIPILEAFSAGCPVVASGATSIPEVGGDAASYFDPRSVEELAEAMLRVIRNPRLRASMIEKGRQRARGFGWDQVAARTMEVYRGCLA